MVFEKNSTIADCVADIGAGIDMVVLDAAHGLPGEVLDFLLILPWVNVDCVFVVHDINIQLYFETRSQAPRVLINTVRAEKFYPRTTEYAYGLPNIGAFIPNHDTRKSLDDLFNVLLMSWVTLLPKSKLAKAREVLAANYSEENVSVFDIAVRRNYPDRKASSASKKDVKPVRARSKLFGVKICEKHRVVSVLASGLSFGQKARPEINGKDCGWLTGYIRLTSGIR